MMKQLVKTLFATAFLAAPVFAQDGKMPMPPYLAPIGNSNTLTDGLDIYNYWCSACHAPGKPGSVAVMMLHEDPMPMDLSDKDLDPDYIKYLVRNGQAAMPHFRQTQISNTQLDALASYLSGGSQ